MKKLNKIRSVDRALSVIKCFIKKESISFSELVKLSKLPNATIARILNSLKDSEYIYKDQKTELYCRGSKMSLLGFSVVNNLELYKVIHSTIEDLAEKTNETANVAVHSGSEFIYVDIVDGPCDIRMNAYKGDRGCLYSTSLGKVLLAFIDNEILEKVLEELNFVKKTKNTIVDVDILRKELKK